MEASKLDHASETGSLPADHAALTARRLGIATAIAAALHLVYLVLFRTVWVSQSNIVGMLTGIAGVVVSVAAAAYTLSAPRPAPRVALVAVGYEIFLTLTLGISESWAVSYAVPSLQVPWSAVVIVLFPFLIPARARVILGASLAAAGTTPLAMALVLAITGKPWPSGPVTASYVLPPFLCALLSWAPTIALHRLGAAVQEARRLGSYQLTERLGHGGMGEVWRADHRLLARPAAVKLIKPEMLGATDASSRQMLIRRFEEEAQTTASLASAHTVELYDFGVSSDGVLFYVMELLDGLDAQTLVERFGPLPPERVIHLMMQACDSLEEAHQRGLIHRDVKPANLFVARKGGVCDFLKVLDFGLVKRWRRDEIDVEASRGGTDAGPSQTAIGQIVGTPAFLAPEAALGEKGIDGRADLYALGCVAYWMLTAKMVFDETSTMAMAIAHVSKEPEPPSDRVSQPIGFELEQAVMKCLRKDREERPRSAKALRDLLAGIIVEQPWSRERAADWWRDHIQRSTVGALDPAG